MTDHPTGSIPQPDRGAVHDGLSPLTDQVKAGPGGAMTDEVGVITGDVTLTTEASPDGRASVRIQYTGAAAAPKAPTHFVSARPPHRRVQPPHPWSDRDACGHT
ncbi:hypothetical protein ABZY57_09430 [Streptomyces sp. NPDC006450]|uniref:hypothetical protein n=1 Tax=Streptomyces sp. NPDC006450 TaxID=3155458 RepID=UPI0033B590E0